MGEAALRVRGCDPGQGVKAYIVVYTWFMGASGQAATDRMKKLIHIQLLQWRKIDPNDPQGTRSDFEQTSSSTTTTALPDSKHSRINMTLSSLLSDETTLRKVPKVPTEKGKRVEIAINAEEIKF